MTGGGAQTRTGFLALDKVENVVWRQQSCLEGDVERTDEAADLISQVSGLNRCAPGRIRTCAPASGGRCSIP